MQSHCFLALGNLVESNQLWIKSLKDFVSCLNLKDAPISCFSLDLSKRNRCSTLVLAVPNRIDKFCCYTMQIKSLDLSGHILFSIVKSYRPRTFGLQHRNPQTSGQYRPWKSLILIVIWCGEKGLPHTPKKSHHNRQNTHLTTTDTLNNPIPHF